MLIVLNVIGVLCLGVDVVVLWWFIWFCLVGVVCVCVCMYWLCCYGVWFRLCIVIVFMLVGFCWCCLISCLLSFVCNVIYCSIVFLVVVVCVVVFV